MTLVPLTMTPAPRYPVKRQTRKGRRRRWLPAAAFAAATVLAGWSTPAGAETTAGAAAEAPMAEQGVAEPEAPPRQIALEEPPPPPPPPELLEEQHRIPGGSPEPGWDRPVSEWSTWIGLGGGALFRTERDEIQGLFDFGVGFHGTVGLDRQGNIRLGPWAEARTRTFTSISPRGGLELFLGALPAGLDMFHYRGEGILSIRAGAGYSWRGEEGALVDEGVVVAGTVAWGYRAPWRLWNSYEGGVCDGYPCRRPARYMVEVRLYVSAEGGVTEDRYWQVTGGLEFEPIGSFRYIFGLV